ncbi:MAG: D-alanyl-D-alanine carboxypeptidase/D-alanyl-D-alanine-endopeptidase [Chitinophagaceae bacterium]
MRVVFLFLLFAFANSLYAQNVADKLENAWQKFESDSQLRSALSSLYVVNAKNGTVVFDKNSRIGLATASTLKIVTAASAYELLGKDFRYETKFGYLGKVKSNILYGSLYVQSVGDPTLGSWRWKTTKDSFVLGEISEAMQRVKIKSYGGSININEWVGERIPDGWIWEDLGNYYGAGAAAFNWRENQVDVLLKSGTKIGDRVEIVTLEPKTSTPMLQSFATSAAKGTGDNAYVYFPLGSSNGVVRGTIPINENNFKISASMPNPALFFSQSLSNYLIVKNKMTSVHYEGVSEDTTFLFSHLSPSVDSIVYWFLKRSINLYGEALVKTIAYQNAGIGSTEKSVELVKKYWKDKGIDPVELNMVDGSGLSPLNRVTTHAQVQVLQYAKNQPWFSGYYDAFPVYNEMKMKSGTIRGVKGFCGYQKAKDGSEYIFSFLVNNYNGSSASLIQKMYKVLDELK